jgi:hypothetical protein
MLPLKGTLFVDLKEPSKSVVAVSGRSVVRRRKISASDGRRKEPTVRHVNHRPDHNRLLEAADASLRAAALRTAQVGGRPIEHPADLVGTSLQPECLDTFTKSEIEEACDFLLRLGFFERSKNTWTPL